jgi:MoaA/NifB/PqqE/SkfB family radical SAM enzyme
MANKHCRKLSNSAHLTYKNNKLLFQPCCWVQPNNIDISDKIKLAKTRKIFIEKVESNIEKFCSECLNREKFGYGESDRQKVLEFIPEDATITNIYDLFLQIDTTCNAACVMCGPHFSSLWGKQLDPAFKLKNLSEQYEKLNKLDNWKKLTSVTFLGGEPFLSENNFIFLKNIPNPENVSLSFNTNGSISIVDYSIKSILMKFKKVSVSFSIDGIDDIFEYIRWPLKWNKVSKNIYEYVTEDFQRKNRRGINITVNPMNLIYINDVVNHFKNNYKNMHINTSVCYGTWGLDATPKKLRQYIEEKFGRNHTIVKMLESQPEIPGKFNTLIENMEYLDSVRNLSYKDTFQEVFKILK